MKIFKNKIVLLIIGIEILAIGFLFFYPFYDNEEVIKEASLSEKINIDYNNNGVVDYDDYYINAKCPENCSKDEQLETYFAQKRDFYLRNPNASLDDWMKYRMEFLLNHKCIESLRDVLDGGSETGYMRSILLKNFEEDINSLFYNK